MIRGFGVDRAAIMLDAINHAEAEQLERQLEKVWGSFDLIGDRTGATRITDVLSRIHQEMLESATEQNPLVDDAVRILYEQRWDLYETDED